MSVRRAEPKDREKIYELVKEAFKTAEVSNGEEQNFVNTLRESENYIPYLEFVYEEDGELIGHVMLTKQTVKSDDGDIQGVLVAPLCVKLERRNDKIGAILLCFGLMMAKVNGYGSAFLVGNPKYYGRFGFVETGKLGVKNASDIPDEVVLGLELIEGSLKNKNCRIYIE